MRKIMEMFFAIIVVLSGATTAMAGEVKNGTFIVVPANLIQRPDADSVGTACASFKPVKVGQTDDGYAIARADYALNRTSCSSSSNSLHDYWYAANGVLILGNYAQAGKDAVLVQDLNSEPEARTQKILDEIQASQQAVVNGTIAVNNCVLEVDAYNADVRACREQYYVSLSYMQARKEQYDNKDVVEYEQAQHVAEMCCGEEKDAYEVCRANPGFKNGVRNRPDGLVCKITNTIQDKALDPILGKAMDILILGN